MISGVQLQGLDAMAPAIQAAIERATMGVEGTQIAIVAGGSRGQARNSLIAKVQAGMLRDPFYFSTETRQLIRFLSTDLWSRDYSTRKRAIDEIGKAMLVGVLSNVEKQRNATGAAFRRLTEAYASFKRRKYGFVTPILRATGDLLGGLRVKVDRAP